MDLETFRQAAGLSYKRLATLIGVPHASRVRYWALGHCWPDADKLQRILDATENQVTLRGMHRRRLSYLAENAAGRVSEKSGPARDRVTVLNSGDAPPCFSERAFGGTGPRGGASPEFRRSEPGVRPAPGRRAIPTRSGARFGADNDNGG